LRNMGGEAPGKKVFVSVARSRYKGIKEFNEGYGTTFSSFDELQEARSWSSVTSIDEVDDAEDNRAFLMKILERYYAVAYGAVREFDTNHLMFGDILNANTGAPDEVVSLATGYSDLVAYQFYGYYEEQRAILDRWSRLANKPLFHADSCFSVAYKEMPAPIGAVCPDQEARARAAIDFAAHAFARPDFVGWNWCGWMDMWAAWKGDRQHSGLQDPFGRYHQPMPEALRSISARLYQFGEQANDETSPLC